MSQGKAAGQPVHFFCAACRKKRHIPSFRVGSVQVTGRTREQTSAGHNMHNWPNTAYEYRCSCGHVGWSRHPQVKRLYEDKVTT